MVEISKQKRLKRRTIIRQKLKAVDIKRSAPVSKNPLQISLDLEDAFKFLARQKANSVDLIVSSPPYFMGKEYDKSHSIEGFIADHKKLAPLLSRVLKPGGSLCWQIGHHVKKGVTIPLDALVYPIFSAEENLFLRNRIVWTFGHGVHAKTRFSGRHETILWFTKGHKYQFNLDPVRVPQKYPGKRHYKGPNRGEFSGNPLGKNPSDVWEIPNVNARHIEKTDHPCQFPVALVQRLIRALTKSDGSVCDPFLGSGSSAVAAALEQRSFKGCDINPAYLKISKQRIEALKKGEAKFRPIEKPIYIPKKNEAVAIRPAHFAKG